MLKLSNVQVRFPGSKRQALVCPELAVAPGEVVALTGRSGSGKSTLALTILGLLPETAERSGTVRFHDLTLSAMPESALRPLRGKRLAFIPQDVAAAPSPYLTIARQLTEVAEVHAGLSGAEARRRAAELLARLRIDDAATRMHEHPHRWSGGMLQRALIAMALMVTPELIIADEPTSALDAAAGEAVIQLFRERASAGAGVLLITHDRELIDSLAARVVAL